MYISLKMKVIYGFTALKIVNKWSYFYDYAAIKS